MQVYIIAMLIIIIIWKCQLLLKIKYLKLLIQIVIYILRYPDFCFMRLQRYILPFLDTKI